jgi:hypothetical protein
MPENKNESNIFVCCVGEKLITCSRVLQESSVSVPIILCQGAVGFSQHCAGFCPNMVRDGLSL